MDAFKIGQQVAQSINSGGTHTLLDKLKTLVEEGDKQFGKPLKIDNFESIEGTDIGNNIHVIKTVSESQGNYSFILQKKGTNFTRLMRLRRYPTSKGTKLYQLSLEYEQSVVLPINIIKSKILFLQEMRALLMK